MDRVHQVEKSRIAVHTTNSLAVYAHHNVKKPNKYIIFSLTKILSTTENCNLRRSIKQSEFTAEV